MFKVQSSTYRALKIESGMFGDLLKAQAHWPPFDLTQGVSKSNHDRRGLLFGRHFINNPH